MTTPDNRRVTHSSIYYFCLAGISFFLPVFGTNFPVGGKIVPALIILFILNWIIEAPYRRTFLLLFKEKSRLLLFSFSFLYLLYLIGMTYSSNQKFGWEDLEIKLSMLMFPLVFSTLEEGTVSVQKINRVMGFFIAGCLVGTLILLGHSWYNQSRNHLDHAFYYENFSWYFHCTYLSMYLSFAVAVIAWKIIFGETGIRPVSKILMILLSIYFLVVIVLLSSKAGILSLALVMIFFSALLIIRKKNWLTGMMVMITSLLTLYLGMLFFPYVNDRISTAGNRLKGDPSLAAGNAESTAERIMVWKAGLEIIRENLLFGIGTGDIKDELMSKYTKYNNKPAFDMKLNAHNQYIQTSISLGLPGFLILAAMLLLPMLFAYRQKKFLYVIFLLLFAMNIAFESMLEVQAGVVFYSFFNAFFFWGWKVNFPDPDNPDL